MKREIKDLFSPLQLKDDRVGKFSIETQVIPAGEEITVVSSRQTLFSGKRGLIIRLDIPLVIRKLVERGKGVWMSDSPYEIEAHREVIHKCRGKVLIGGLGLGYITKLLDDKPDVESITVIEKEKDIVKLVWDKLKTKKAKVITQDLFTYLAEAKNKGERFDWAYYDIWTSTGEDTLYTHTRPLRKLSRGVVSQGRILCWEEEIMLGQVKLNLATTLRRKTL